MVERLKLAIEKAREGAAKTRRAAGHHGGTALGGDAPVDKLWEQLEQVKLSSWKLKRERIITYEKCHPAHVVFDRLRTRVRNVLRENGWTRVAICSPTKGCGKSVISTNLAFSFARQLDYKVMLIDMDLRAPRINKILGVKPPSSFARLFTEECDADDVLIRATPNLALGLTTHQVRNSAEICQSERTSAALERMRSRFMPDVILFDLPPMLPTDDALAFIHNVDCVFIVVAAGKTVTDEIVETEKLLQPETNVLGVILNRCDEKLSPEYGND